MNGTPYQVRIVLTPMYKPNIVTPETADYSMVKTNNNYIEIHTPAKNDNHWLNFGNGQKSATWSETPTMYNTVTEKVVLNQFWTDVYDLVTVQRRHDIQVGGVTDETLSEYRHLAITLRYGVSHLRKAVYWTFDSVHLERVDSL